MSPIGSLPTRRFTSHADASRYFHDQGWTDGLPIVAPTPDSVHDMASAVGRAPAEVVGEFPPRRRSLSVWQAATYAVMAGCEPAHFPMVLATWEAMFDARFNLQGVLSSSGGAAILAVASGPGAAEIGMNAGSGLLGPGNRANATIGRAIRLGIIAGLGVAPGGFDASAFGHAGKYTFHFAESEPPPPWSPVRVRLGFARDATTVTILGAGAPRQTTQRTGGTPESILAAIATSMRTPAQNVTGHGSYFVVVLGPEHASIICEHGWSDDMVRDELADTSKVTVAEAERAGFHPTAGPDEDGRYVTARPSDILVVTAGGHGAAWSLVIGCWTRVDGTKPVTREVVRPGVTTGGRLTVADSSFS